MPLIPSKVEADEVLVRNTKTLVLNVEKTKELILQQEENEDLGLSYKQIEEMKERYVSNEIFQDILNHANTEYWVGVRRTVENVDIFYKIVWNRTRLELIFLSEYYINSLRDPLAFELLQKNGVQFDHWFQNTVKYTILVKLRKFYDLVARKYADLVPIDIYEKDIVFKAKKSVQTIEEAYLDDVKALLRHEWGLAKEYYDNVFKKLQEEKRKAIIFD